MNILLIGSGGREHALALALKNSESCNELYCSPGNPGIFSLAQNANIAINDFNAIANFCKLNKIDLVVVGPEQPLADGLTDFLVKQNINVFGPTKNAAQLEASKNFAKDFMAKYNIPTAIYKSFKDSESKLAHNYIDNHQFPVVLKADGLAAGKGVVIAYSKENAHEVLDLMFSGLFKEAGKTVVVEDFIEGHEVSILAICDGKDYVILSPSQDHKRAGDLDTGKNTGGMGAYSPTPIINDSIIDKVKSRVIEPTLKGMINENSPFIGCLYAGLMIKNGEPYVIEYNARFGDPETQVVLPIIDGDFAQLLYSAAVGNIQKDCIKNVASAYSCCVILASSGYPDDYKKGYEITGIEEAEANGAIVFHAGTDYKNNTLVTNGGRVLGVTALGNTLKSAVDNAYKAIDKIQFKDKFFRHDIASQGLRILDK